jgi:hypothetical protein
MLDIEQTYEYFKKYLQESGLQFDEYKEEQYSFVIPFNHETTTLITRLTIFEDKLLFITFVPNRIPVDRRNPVAELINLFNYNYTIGNLVMDGLDGEVSYRMASFLDNQNIIATDTLDKIISTCLRSITDIIPSLLRVAFADVSAYDEYTNMTRGA